MNINKQKSAFIHIFSVWSPDSVSPRPPYRNRGQMLPQPINSSECHALHVMYVLFVYAVYCKTGFSLLGSPRPTLNKFYLPNSAKLKTQWQQWKLQNYRPACICPFGWTLQRRLEKLLPGQRRKKECRRRNQRPEPPPRTRGELDTQPNILHFNNNYIWFVWVRQHQRNNSNIFL